MMINISGTTYSAFFQQTKAAFEAITGSALKKGNDAPIRRFLAKQLFPESNIGENEHTLASLFDDKTYQTPIERAYTANVIMVEYYESGSYGDKLESVDSYICVGDEAMNRKLAELFSHHYGDSGTGSNLLNHWAIEEKIEHLASDQGDDDKAINRLVKEITEQVRALDASDACDWLLEHFDIDGLTEDEFFGDFLNMNMKKIRIDPSELFY
jgi:hypothetical protein